MKNVKGELLFGNVAVLLGFATEKQVHDATHHQEELLKHGVRKPLGQVLYDDHILTKDQVRAVVQYQEFRRERSADKKLGSVAVLNNLLTKSQLQDALKIQKEFFKNNRKTYPLGRILVDRGFLTDQQLKALVRLQQRLISGAARETRTQVGIRECGNCFEIVPLKAAKCPKCANVFEELTLQAKCKACGHNQGGGGEFCKKCGANMVSGRMPHPEKVHRCKKCSGYTALYAPNCTHCGYVWDATMIRHKKHEKMKRKLNMQSAWSWVVGGGVLLIFLVVLFNVGSILRWFRETAEGDEFLISEKVDEYINAFKFRDEKAFKDYDALFERRFSLSPKEYAVSSAKVDRIKVEGSKATAYVTFTIGKIDTKAGDPGNKTLTQILEGLGELQKRDVALYLTKTGDAWRVTD